MHKRAIGGVFDKHPGTSEVEEHLSPGRDRGLLKVLVRYLGMARLAGEAQQFHLDD